MEAAGAAQLQQPLACEGQAAGSQADEATVGPTPSAPTLSAASVRAVGSDASTRSILPQRSGSFEQACSSLDPELPGDVHLFSIEDLKSSWFLVFLRMFNTWAFLLANVTTAGNGINTFLNMFLEFSKYVSENKRVLELEDWSQIAHLVCTAALLVLTFAGLLQRGWWLLRDCLNTDMFANYRRTLCLEGPGPGTFPIHKQEIRLRSHEDARYVHSRLTSSCALERDIRAGEVGRVSVLKGSQLLASGCMLDRHGREDLLEVDAFPAVLHFRVDARPAAFSGVDCLHKVRAAADLVFQFLIYLSLDLIPLVWGLWSVESYVDVLSLQWLTTVTTTAIEVCIVHVWIYLVVSTLVDYGWKVGSIFRLCKSPRLDAMPAAVSRARRMMDVAAREFMMQEAFGTAHVRVRNTLSRDDHLNLCVRLRNLFIKPGCHVVLLVTFVAELISYMILSLMGKGDLAMFISILSGLTLCLLVYFKCRLSSRDLTQGFESLAGHPDAGPAAPSWAALWFHKNCGVSPLPVFAKAACLFAMSSLVVVGLVSARFWGLVPVAMAGLIWSIVVMTASICLPDRLWIFVLAEALAFGSVTLFVAARESKDWSDLSLTDGGLLMSVGLILLTQLGMWRQGKSHAHSLSVGFFVVIAVAIAALSLMASASNTGHSFAEPNLEFCAAGMFPCQEFQFPLHGQPTYEFCGLSWAMGEGDTVSDRCEDTRLSIIDFGQISTIAGYLPNTSQVDLTIEKYLPGWQRKHVQIYNITAGTHTTFVHLVRGSTHVIAVRGTSSIVEVLQDLNLWMRIGFLQLARKIGPSCYSVRGVLQAITVNRTELMGKSFSDLAEYVGNVTVSARPWETIYITGHSLGGGLATAVGAIFDIPAVTFSAPGLKATSAILQPSPQEPKLLRRSVNVVPKNDLVPMVDEQTGSTLRVQCHMKNPLGCHRLGGIMCELLSTCGDGGGRRVPRGYRRSCDACRPFNLSPPEICSPARGARAWVRGRVGAT